MDLKAVHEGIKPHKRRKRIGRGPGSKRGKTATRGHNGQKSRSGSMPSLLKEGGQMPLFRRLPKRGFNNANWRIEYTVVNVADLEGFADGDTVTVERLREAGLVPKSHGRLKVLGDGDVGRKVDVHAHAFSKSAEKKIEEAGGKCVRIAAPHRGPKIRNKMRPRKPKRPID